MFLFASKYVRVRPTPVFCISTAVSTAVPHERYELLNAKRLSLMEGETPPENPANVDAGPTSAENRFCRGALFAAVYQ